MISNPFSWERCHIFLSSYKVTAASTKSLGVSFIKPFQSKVPAIASAPIEEVTLGVPHCMASNNFPLIPAPKRRGAKTTSAFLITSKALSALPII